MAGEDSQNSDAERAVLILLAPHPRRKVHQRGECSVRPAERPDADVLVRIERNGLAHEADGGRHVSRLLNRRFESRSNRIAYSFVVAP